MPGTPRRVRRCHWAAKSGTRAGWRGCAPYKHETNTRQRAVSWLTHGGSSATVTHRKRRRGPGRHSILVQSPAPAAYRTMIKPSVASIGAPTFRSTKAAVARTGSRHPRRASSQSPAAALHARRVSLAAPSYLERLLGRERARFTKCREVGPPCPGRHVAPRVGRMGECRRCRSDGAACRHLE
jgi:hypothetical protein